MTRCGQALKLKKLGGKALGRLRLLSLSLLLVPWLAIGQETPDSIEWFHPNQEVRVRDLPSQTVFSKEPSTVLATELEMVLQNKAVCCGRDSSLGDEALAAPLSLKELSAKLQGRHFLSDGRPILVKAQYLQANAINSGVVVGGLLAGHAELFEWKSRVYVLYGAIYNETLYYSGARQYAIVKLLLLDPRFSDQGRLVMFDRQMDDLGNVQGLLSLAVEPQ